MKKPPRALSRRNIIELLKKHPHITPQEVADQLGVHYTTVCRGYNWLVEHGYAVLIDPGGRPGANKRIELVEEDEA